ncbi:MAG: AraC family transcriptional regulator [Defluviitaleaceae bacterium]|nr:AraC family transcriptional regulator [Defluviitaleaceae bacterium]
MKSLLPLIELQWASHRKRDPMGFRKVVERGQDAILFLHFITPAIVVIDGEDITLARDGCIIYTPGIRQEFGAVSPVSSYENNFVTFKTDVETFLASFNLPTNRPFYVSSPDEITRMVEHITWAAANHESPLDEAGISQGIIDLFVFLEKGLEDENLKNQRQAHTKQRFILIRGKMMIDPKGWTVDKMAKACWLTRSRFTVLYKQFFGISPGQDLNNIVVEYAKGRLISTDDTIAHIAADCGYTKPESFIRMFSDKIGITPGQYRRDNYGSQFRE